MRIRGVVEGDKVRPVEPLAVPDGTEVEVLPEDADGRKERKRSILGILAIAPGEPGLSASIDETLYGVGASAC